MVDTKIKIRLIVFFVAKDGEALCNQQKQGWELTVAHIMNSLLQNSLSIMVIQVYAPTSNAEEAEVEWFYEEVQELLELTPKKDVLSIIEN